MSAPLIVFPAATPATWPVAAAPPAVGLERLSVILGDRVALRDFDLAIPSGVLVALIGPNGSGKTTALRAIAGLVRPRRGRVRVFGESVSHERRRIAYVAQREEVHWEFPVTVGDVAEMGGYRRAGWLRRLSAQDRADALEALREVGLEAQRNEQIGDLSGGQQQRAFIARALMQRADLLLLDEPLNGVDAATEERVTEILRKRVAAGGTVIMATHDLEAASHTCDVVVMLNGGELIAAGAPGEVLTPEILARAYGGPVRFHDEGLDTTVASAASVHHDAH